MLFYQDLNFSVSSREQDEPGSDDDSPFMHAFFTRQGGAGTGLYESLNCSPSSEDDVATVRRNREIAAETLGLKTPARLLTLSQRHSARAIYATPDELWDLSAQPEGDALVTDAPGLAVGVLTADCAPVLLAGEKEDGAPVVAAAHAGWQGALEGILEACVAMMQEKGARLSTIRASVGPCIDQASYEVEADFVTRFIQRTPEVCSYFVEAGTEGRFMFDLPGYVMYRLGQAGVVRISNRALNTYSNESDFFSYRRATHRGEPDYGRQLSAILIPE